MNEDNIANLSGNDVNTICHHVAHTVLLGKRANDNGIYTFMTVEDNCQNVYVRGHSLSVIKVKRGFAIGAIRDELVRHGIIVQWERDRRNLSGDFTDITATYRALFSSDTIEKDAAILEADFMTCILNFQQYISILKKQKSANVSLPGSIGNEFQNGSHSTSDDTIRLLPATASTTITPNLYDSVIKAAAINAQLSKRNAELESSQSAIKLRSRISTRQWSPKEMLGWQL